MAVGTSVAEAGAGEETVEVAGPVGVDLAGAVAVPVGVVRVAVGE